MKRIVLIMLFLILFTYGSALASSPVNIEMITVGSEVTTVPVGKTATIKVTVEPKNATNKKLEWTTSDDAVATVKNGLVKGIGNGETIITATATDGSNASATVKVQVVVPVQKISFKDKKITLAEDTMWRLYPVFTPMDATVKDVEWSSANDKIASVNEKGLVTGHKVGKTTILCKALDGSKKTAAVTVNVKKYDIVLREPGEYQTNLNLSNDYQTSEISFPGYHAKSVYERYVWYPNDVIAHAGGNKIKPLKAGAGTIECVAKNNGRVTEKWSRSVYVAQNVFIEDDAKIVFLKPSEYEGHTYQIFYSKRNWKNAKAFCERYGGHLVTITDREEQRFVEIYMKDILGVGTFWIGMTNGSNRKLAWVTNEPISYTNWMGDNPDYGGTNSGVRIASRKLTDPGGWQMDRGTWDDVPESFEPVIGFICEWDEDNSPYAFRREP